MSGNKKNAPDQGGVGFSADDVRGAEEAGGAPAAATTADTGGAAGGGQDADRIASSGRHTHFNHASPDSNVNPPGAPQSSHGSATRPIPGGATGQAGDRTAAQAEGQDSGAGIGGSAGGGAGTSA